MATLYLRPNAAGDETNLLPIGATYNWECVDEATPDEDATYVLNGMAGSSLRDLYGLGDTSQTGTINWIKVWVRCLYATSQGYAYTVIKVSGYAAREGSANALTTSYANYSTQYATNPDVGGAWTWAQLNALQAGIKLQTGADKASTAACTQVYVEVNYTVGAGRSFGFIIG